MNAAGTAGAFLTGAAAAFAGGLLFVGVVAVCASDGDETPADSSTNASSVRVIAGRRPFRRSCRWRGRISGLRAGLLRLVLGIEPRDDRTFLIAPVFQLQPVGRGRQQHVGVHEIGLFPDDGLEQLARAIGLSLSR